MLEILRLCDCKQFWECLFQDDVRFDSAQPTVAGLCYNDLFKMK